MQLLPSETVGMKNIDLRQMINEFCLCLQIEIGIYSSLLQCTIDETGTGTRCQKSTPVSSLQCTHHSSTTHLIFYPIESNSGSFSRVRISLNSWTLVRLLFFCCLAQ